LEKGAGNGGRSGGLAEAAVQDVIFEKAAENGGSGAVFGVISTAPQQTTSQLKTALSS
jgi:hypothetical protein